jgi:hypothetical protein
MQSIQLNTTVNADGVLRVEMPPELKNKNLEITIVSEIISAGLRFVILLSVNGNGTTTTSKRL